MGNIRERSAMHSSLPLRRPAKGDRNTHEGSGDESLPAQSRRQRDEGGGHRSGSRGAGTLDTPDGDCQQHDAPVAVSRRC